jgi:hypothetical protein
MKSFYPDKDPRSPRRAAPCSFVAQESSSEPIRAAGSIAAGFAFTPSTISEEAL